MHAEIFIEGRWQRVSVTGYDRDHNERTTEIDVTEWPVVETDIRRTVPNDAHIRRLES